MGITVTAVLVILIGGVGMYLGIFSSVKWKERTVGPFKLAYKDYQGPYKNTASIQDEIYESLLAKGIETYKGFGIYYDDPKDTPSEALRSQAGCIIEEKDYEKLQTIEHGFDQMDLEEKKYIRAEFPYKTQLSIMIGITKVYPALEKFIEKHNYSKREIMEIYDVPNKKIIYLMPID